MQGKQIAWHLKRDKRRNKRMCELVVVLVVHEWLVASRKQESKQKEKESSQRWMGWWIVGLVGWSWWLGCKVDKNEVSSLAVGSLVDGALVHPILEQHRA